MKRRLSFEMEEVRAIRNQISCRTPGILPSLLPIFPCTSQSSLSDEDPLPVPFCILGNGLSLLGILSEQLVGLGTGSRVGCFGKNIQGKVLTLACYTDPEFEG